MSGRTSSMTVGWELVTSVNAVPLAVATPLHWNAPNLVAQELLGSTHLGLDNLTDKSECQLLFKAVKAKYRVVVVVAEKFDDNEI
jgi:hypothetical protein